MTEDRVRRIGPEERSIADPTPGQTREEALSTDTLWCGIVRAGPNDVSAWHHHGRHSTMAFVLSGIKRLEYGAAGTESVQGSPGDFLYIPPEVIHRESNPSDAETATVAIRTGSGPPTVGVDGPGGGGEVRRIPPHDRSVGDPTPGMIREEAVALDGLWSGFVRTAPGVVSGWHHHGHNETVIYLAAGAMRIESGRGGEPAVDLGPGDFCYIPPGIVHRESNPSDVESHAVVVRAGTGPPTINVDGPEGGSQ